MQPARTYSAAEIREIVEVLRNGGELSNPEIARMNKPVGLLAHLETRDGSGH